MTKKLFLSLIAVSLGMSLSAQIVTGVNITNFQAKSTDSNPKMFVIPIVASMEIIQDAPTFFSTTGVIKIPDNNNTVRDYMALVNSTVKARIEELKSQALFEFSEKTGADLILSPMYSITTVSNTGLTVNVTIKIKGYPARYTKFREMTENDSKLIGTAAMIDEDITTRKLDSKSWTNNETVIKK